MTTTATFTFVSEENINLGKVIGELLQNSDFEYIKATVNDNEPFNIEYSYQEAWDGQVFGIGTGYIDSEEEY